MVCTCTCTHQEHIHYQLAFLNLKSPSPHLKLFKNGQSSPLYKCTLDSNNLKKGYFNIPTMAEGIMHIYYMYPVAVTPLGIPFHPAEHKIEYIYMYMTHLDLLIKRHCIVVLCCEEANNINLEYTCNYIVSYDYNT